MYSHITQVRFHFSKYQTGVINLGFNIIPLIFVDLDFVFVFGAIGMFAMYMSNTKK